MNITASKSWYNLKNHKAEIENTSIQSLFNNKQRFNQFSFELNDVLFDFSKQYINNDTLDLLLKLLHSCNYKNKIKAMFAGEKINNTENRMAFHIGLRAENPTKEVQFTLDKMEKLVNKVNSNEYIGASNDVITDIISVGIGGSDLGPRMVCQALDKFKQSIVKIHFISNTDNSSLNKLITKLNPNHTVAIINSKSFTTIETLSIASIIQKWFDKEITIPKASKQHMIAVTANIQKAITFGIDKDNIFELWDWVGGRYSVWSAVGLPIAISLGMKQFRDFLHGANIVDKHFYSTPSERNIPILMALTGIWNNNFLDYSTLAVMPYLDCLELFPAYLQQLEMESNGKSTDVNGNQILHHTAPIIWGGVGCNNQHAYMQLLHQGSQVIPTDFLLSVNSSDNKVIDKTLDKLLFASCIGQSQALMNGNGLESTTNSAKLCKGNKPSTTIVFPKITPSILGSLIATYEHKVFIQGIVWQIQSFDQWGVELGKKLTNNLLPLLSEESNNQYTSSNVRSKLDSSTLGLLQYYQKHCKI